MFCRTTEMCGCFEDQRLTCGCFEDQRPTCGKAPVIEERSEPTPDSSIFKVPKCIREINEGSYTPRLVSIGLFPYGKEKLKGIEKQKKRYLDCFRKRNSSEKMKEISRFIKDNVGRILDFYSEITGEIEKSEFERMILHDAIFIIELFLRNYENTSDFLLDTPAIKGALALDLQLLENQLPFFLTEDLCKLSIACPTFMNLAYNFFHSTDSSFDLLARQSVEVKNFTDLRRSIMLNTTDKNYGMRLEPIVDLPSAVELCKSGVKFKHIKGGRLLDITFEKKIVPWLNCEAELQMPILTIYDDTETLLRNVMALEQCLCPHETRVCSYIELINNLIHTEKDVDLLVKEGIIRNFMGHYAAVANMFNRLSLHMYTRNFSYDLVCEELKEHYANPWNHVKATLKRVFCDVLKGTGTAGAIAVVLLTFIQAVCSIIQASR